MDDPLTTQWNRSDLIDVLTKNRFLFRGAHAHVVREVFEKYASETPLLEIGSGLGELVSIVSERAEQIQQTEQSWAIALENKLRNPRSNVMLADVYGLPFPADFYDTVVGYSVFDTLAHLDAAAREMHRVLRSEGKVIHFLDCIPDRQAAVYYYRQRGMYVFPVVGEHDELLPAFQLIPVASFEEEAKALESRVQHILQLYNKEAGKYMGAIRNPDVETILKSIAAYVTDFSSGRTVSLLDVFETRVTEAFQSAGYTIFENRLYESVHRESRATCQRQIPLEGNHFKSTFAGVPVFYADMNVRRYGKDIVQFTSEVHVLVAQKT